MRTQFFTEVHLMKIDTTITWISRFHEAISHKESVIRDHIEPESVNLALLDAELEGLRSMLSDLYGDLHKLRAEWLP